MTDIPEYIFDLMCALSENTTDEELISEVIYSLFGNISSAARMTLFLEKAERSSSEIRAYLSSLV